MLDFFQTFFEIVNYDEMNEIASYGGFPTRYPHWRYGMEYEQLSKSYSYGLSKIYDVCKRWKESGGMLSCIDTTGGSKLMQEFGQMAAEGGGEATFLNDERAIVKQLVVLIFGTKWKDEIDKVYESVLKGPEDTVEAK